MFITLAAATWIAAAPAPQSCQQALGPLHEGPELEALPGRVDGGAIAGPQALRALRRERGDALIVVVGGDFAGGDFRGAELHNICFVETDLSGSDWRAAEAPGVGFVGANLEGADLSGADLRGVLLRNAELKDARAERADLRGGRFDGGWFDGSVENFRLDHADLAGFRFECGALLDDGCPVYQGGEEMSLRGANLAGATLWAGDLAGARIDGTHVGLGHLYDLRAARIEGPVVLHGADAVATLSPDEYRALLPHVRNPADTADSTEAPAGPPAWAAPGTYVLFVNAPLLSFDADFRDHPLFARLLPVLVGASSSRVVVRFNGDGSLDAAGDSIGANGHMCFLAGEGLRFDPATGWYSGPQEPQEDHPPAWRGRPMAVVMLSGDRALANDGALFAAVEGEGDPRLSDYVSCGARASFSEMVRVPVGEDEARRVLESLRERD